MTGPARTGRVLMIGHTAYPWDPRVRREAQALIGAGYDVEILCLREKGEPARETIDGARVVRLPVRRHRGSGKLVYLAEYAAFFALAAREVMHRTMDRPPDVVQVHTLPDVLVFAAAGLRARGSRVLLDLHEAMPEFYASKYGLPPGHGALRGLERAESAGIGFADHVLTVSDAIRDVLVRRGASASKITVVMNTAAPEMAAAHPSPPARWGTPERPLRLVYHGALSELYDLGVVLRAMQVLARDGGGVVELTVAGSGTHEPAAQRLAVELDLGDRVRFLGQRDFSEMKGLLAAADAGIIPMRADAYMDLAMPTKLLECVAAGLPVLVTRRKTVAGLFPADSVYYFEPGDAAGLAACLRELAANPGEAGARAGRAAACAEPASWEHMKNRYVECVRRLSLRGHRSRTR